MKPGIYDAFDSAFKRVNAYALLHDGRAVGRVAIKWPADGMGRAAFYLQAWGLEMVKGTAGGCGYDKATAAAYSAGLAMANVAAKERAAGKPESHMNMQALAHADAIGLALFGEGDGGTRWNDRLQAAGYIVAAAI